jgi:uroporphyrinogen decarboxylase
MLTSRQRVERVLNHQEADRVPLDLGTTFFTAYHLEVAKEVNKQLGVEQDDYQFVSFSAQTVKAHPVVLDKLKIDTYGINSKPTGNFRFELNRTDNSYIDEWNIHYRKAEHSYQYDFIKHPLDNAGIADLDLYPWPDPLDQGRFKGFREEVKSLYENTDYALILNTPVGSQIMGMIGWLTGYEKLYTDLAVNHDFIRAISEKLLLWHEEWIGKALELVGEYLTCIAIADDLGIQSGPMINPVIYRKLIKPFHQKLFSFVKSRTDAKILFHSCGSVYEFLPDLIEMGVDIINPIQYSAKDMSCINLKKNFGDRICFWGGGCDAQGILPFGSVSQVREEVERVINILKPGGGYVYAPIHAVLPGVSAEKVLTMYQTALEHGGY